MKLRVGMIGCGMITQKRHAPEYAQNEDVVIGGFFDRNTARSMAMAGQYGGKVYEDYKTMLADDEIDAVSVCAPNFLHAAITVEALNQGKHVLCEKPMALSIRESSQMIRAAEAAGKTLMIGHNQRLLPTHRKAKEVLESGAIGKVLFFQSNFKHSGPENWSIDRNNKTWFFKKEEASFGVFGDLGAHKLDIIRYLTGLEVDEIFAALMTVDKRDEQGSLIQIEDNALCLLKMQGGMTGTMHVSWCNYGNEDNSTILYGEKGVMKIFGDFPDDMVLEMKDGSRIKYHVGNISTNTNQIKTGIIDEFVRASMTGTPPLVTGLDGHSTLAALVAGVESSRTGQWVKVNYQLEP